MLNAKSFELAENNSSSRESSVPWSRRWQLGKPWKYVVVAVGVALFFICTFFGGFYAGSSSASSSSEQIGNLGISSTTVPGSSTTVLPESTFIIPPPDLQWDGVCPKRNGECPVSYRDNPLLLLISMDGFHPDYLEREFTPTLNNLRSCGTSTPFMYSVFPSKTFPNHYSQVTGLNPVSHGIVDNNMYDPIRRKVFRLGNPESAKSYWWSAEPIWVTAAKQGKESGCFFWPGSDVEINSTFPKYYKKYSSKISFNKRVETVLSWMDKPADQRPAFYTLYVNQPDHAAHVNGTKSDSVNQSLKKVDDMIAMMFAGLQERDLLDCVNVIMVSDHGMADTTCDKTVSLNQYLNISELYVVAGPFGRIRLKGLKNITAEQNILDTLRCVSTGYMRAYRKEHLPLRYHYSSNNRIEPLFLDLNAGWMISNYLNDMNSTFCTGGQHGYDNLYPEMRALFMAVGPSFRSNLTVDPFINTELYELMAELIDITPRMNNGTKGSLHHLLENPHLLPQPKPYDPPNALEVPSDKLLIQMNIRAAECNESQFDVQLNMSDIEISNAKLKHVPFGIPHCRYEYDNYSVNLLNHFDFISGYDRKYKMPFWSAFTITTTSSFNEENLQWIADPRISYEDFTRCTFYKDPKIVNNGIAQRPLFPPRFAQVGEVAKSFLLTNSVPKTNDHVSQIEEAFLGMLSKWAVQEGSINIITGPAFDTQYTSVHPGVGSIMQLHDKYGPLVVPTHFYAIITWCKNDSITVSLCEPSALDVVAFLLPNDPVTSNCESAEDLIVKNSARVVDIEGLTGISFFTDLPVYDAIRLRTALPRRQFAS